MAEDTLETKIENKRNFLDGLLDASGAAIGTGFAAKALIIGASGYVTTMMYLIPYGAFKAAKYMLNIIRHPIKSLSLDGLGKAVNDTFLNIIPYREKVPASVGVVSTLLNYNI